MSLATIIAAVVVAVLISAIVAAAGYYLQVRLRRLEKLEEELLAPAAPMPAFAPTEEIPAPPPPMSPPPPPVEEKEPTTPLRRLAPLIVASLIVTKGEQLGTRFKIVSGSLIGRDPNFCDIVLSDESVSRQHAKIRREGDEFFIYDLASTNGTFVNGELVIRAPLRDGDRISMGNTELIFRIQGQE